MLARISALLIATFCSFGSVAEARPGNLERFPVGSARAGLGGAGVASVGSVWFNPAGIGRSTEVGISASLSAYGYTLERSSQFVLWEFPDGSSIEGDLETASVDLFPATLEYVKPFGTLGSLRHAGGISIVVPDFDRFDGKLVVPATDLLLELRARRLSESQTFWIMPGWGACTPSNFCFGFGPTAAVHQASDVSITTAFLELETGDTFDSTESIQFELLTAALGGYAGVQFEVASNFWIGATVRTPTLKIYGSGGLINVLSTVDTANGVAFVDRVESEEPRVQYRMPWRFALGMSYAEPGAYEFAADVRFMTGLSRTALLAGPNGEVTLPPTFPGGQIDDPDRALGVELAYELRPTINANVGGRLYINQSIAGQAGLFTDLSATPEDGVFENGNNQLNRIGVTLGGGWITEDTETWATVVYAFGFGNTLGYGPEFVEELAPLQSHAFMLMLGSSADL